MLHLVKEVDDGTCRRWDPFPKSDLLETHASPLLYAAYNQSWDPFPKLDLLETGGVETLCRRFAVFGIRSLNRICWKRSVRLSVCLTRTSWKPGVWMGSG